MSVQPAPAPGVPVVDFILNELEHLRQLVETSGMTVVDFFQTGQFSVWLDNFRLGILNILNVTPPDSGTDVEPLQTSALGGITYESVYAPLNGWRSMRGCHL